MAEVIAQLEKQLASERKELEYARLKIQVLEERIRLGNAPFSAAAFSGALEL